MSGCRVNDLPRWYREHCDVFSLCELVGGCDLEVCEVMELIHEPPPRQDGRDEE